MILNISAILASPLLGLVAGFVPQAAPVIGFLRANAPLIGAAAPIIQAAIKEGRPAFEAAIERAPQFASAVRTFLEVHGSGHLDDDSTESFHAALENVTRQLVGFHKMTADEEKIWMDSKSPPNDSRFGG